MRGDATSQLLFGRRVKFEQSPAYYNFGQDRFIRQNSYEVSCQPPIIIRRVLSIVQEIYSWSAGAAHPNHGFSTMNFILDPLVKFGQLQDIFIEQESSFNLVQDLVRASLLSGRHGDGKSLEENWVFDGTSEWESFFSYVFTNEGLMIMFGPYQVGPYAAGSHTVVIPYGDIGKLMKAEVAAALGIDYLVWQSS